MALHVKNATSGLLPHFLFGRRDEMPPTTERVSMLTQGVLNLALLDREDSPYALASQRQMGSRTVYKYLCISQEAELLDRASEAILVLFKDNPDLCPTFQIENVRELVSRNRYLTINGEAVCLQDERLAPSDADHSLTDTYFSELLLEQPVRCTRGHYLEQRLATLWAEKKGGRCPAGSHQIGTLEVIAEKKNAVDSFRNEKTERARFLEQFLQDPDALEKWVRREVQSEDVKLADPEKAFAGFFTIATTISSGPILGAATYFITKPDFAAAAHMTKEMLGIPLTSDVEAQQGGREFFPKEKAWTDSKDEFDRAYLEKTRLIQRQTFERLERGKPISDKGRESMRKLIRFKDTIYKNKKWTVE